MVPRHGAGDPERAVDLIADRLRQLEATGVNLSPVFGVYAGAGRPGAVLDGVTGGPPAVDCVDNAGAGRPPRTAIPRLARCAPLGDHRIKHVTVTVMERWLPLEQQIQITWRL